MNEKQLKVFLKSEVFDEKCDFKYHFNRYF